MTASSDGHRCVGLSHHSVLWTADHDVGVAVCIGGVRGRSGYGSGSNGNVSRRSSIDVCFSTKSVMTGTTGTPCLHVNYGKGDDVLQKRFYNEVRTFFLCATNMVW